MARYRPNLSTAGKRRRSVPCAVGATSAGHAEGRYATCSGANLTTATLDRVFLREQPPGPRRAPNGNAASGGYETRHAAKPPRSGAVG